MVESTKITEYVPTKIKYIEYDATQKNNRIVELEHDINKKEEDITDFKREVDDLKSQVISLKMDSQGEELLRRITQEIWDKIA